MPWNEDPKEKSPKDLNEEQKEDSFSFLQETIKPEPITGKQVRKQLLTGCFFRMCGTGFQFHISYIHSRLHVWVSMP